MRMLDWNAYRQQISAGVSKLGRLSPDTVRGYLAINGAGQKTGNFDEKTRELMALVAAVSLRCDGCIAVHTEAARSLGATESEIAEALGVAIGVSAGASIIYATRTLDAFETGKETLP